MEGIENRTGIEKQNLYGFVFKELLDNAIDFLEAQYRGQENNNTITTSTAAAQLEVTISKEANYLRVLVRNSNDRGRVVFTKEMLESIFNFDAFYSNLKRLYLRKFS
ncbi:MAG: ATP-binding protein [Candidatus Nitrosopolaris sp.]